MDIDLASIKAAAGILDQDVEDDDELLAELLALQENADQNTSVGHKNKNQNRGKSTGKIAPESVKVPPPQNQSTHIKMHENTSTLLNDNSADEELELSDTDMDDQGLLAELDNLLDPNSKIKVKQNQSGNIQSTPTSVHHNNTNAADGQTPVSSISHSLVQEREIPPDPEPSSSNNSLAKKAVDRTECVANIPKDEKDESFLQLKAENLLLRRRRLYMDRAKAAKAENDRAAAVEAFETVKMFNQALEAIKEGAQLSEEDLEQIPPSPAPYASVSVSDLPPKKMDSTETQEYEVKKPSAAISTPATKVQHTDSVEKHQMIANDELRLVYLRQTQLRKEAMAAKQRGDLPMARHFLTLAHRMDQMVEAAKCGLPVDVKQIPEIHSISTALPSSAILGGNDAEIMKKCQLLEKELLKQVEFSEDQMTQFQSIGDSKNTLFYEAMCQKSKEDLHKIQMAMRAQTGQLPSFKLIELTLPKHEFNATIPDDQLSLRITKIDKLRLPEGWKPSHCSLFVLYKFPFPHGNHQTGRTTIVRNTESPEFPDTFQLNINRKTKQLIRICKRVPLKLEIYHKGGFLRSDRLFGHADVPLAQLEDRATIEGRFDILEGRKKTGGTVQVKIAISRPLGRDNTATGVVKRKWVKLGG